VADPVCEPLAFARSVVEAVQAHGIRAVLPGTEAAQVALSTYGESIAASGVRVGTGSPRLVERTGSKLLLRALARMAGLSTPPTRTVDARSVASAVQAFGYPLVVKPFRSRVRDEDGTSRTLHVRRANSAADLAEVLGEFREYSFVVQPFVSGELYAVCGLAWEGRVVHAVHQVAERITPEPCGGSAFAQTVPTDAALGEKVGRLVAETGWSGIFQVQILRASDGTDYVIDVNPRIYGTLALAVAAGANLPAMWVDMLLGRAPRQCGPPRRARYRCEEKDALAILTLLRRGRLLRAIAAAAPKPRTVHAVGSLDDPAPILTSIGKLGKLGSPRTVAVRDVLEPA
jgi:predicted ATP-grasp superfamily ATP-dependent carboligase